MGNRRLGGKEIRSGEVGDKEKGEGDSEFATIPKSTPGVEEAKSEVEVEFGFFEPPGINGGYLIKPRDIAVKEEIGDISVYEAELVIVGEVEVGTVPVGLAGFFELVVGRGAAVGLIDAAAADTKLGSSVGSGTSPLTCHPKVAEGQAGGLLLGL